MSSVPFPTHALRQKGTLNANLSHCGPFLPPMYYMVSMSLDIFGDVLLFTLEFMKSCCYVDAAQERDDAVFEA